MSSEEIILFVGALVLGVIKVPFVDWLKNALKLEGYVAFIVAYAVAFGVAALALFLSGELAGGLTWENFFGASTMIIATAQFVYKTMNKAPQS
jgi:hypothetical protein